MLQLHQSDMNVSADHKPVTVNDVTLSSKR